MIRGVRTFQTGANRNSDKDKLDFEGFLSPIVLERFAQYMHKNRKIGGGFRDSDNWQKLFGEEHYAVCMKSGWRHFFSWWKNHREDNKEQIEEDICALIFNAQAYLFKLLNEKK